MRHILVRSAMLGVLLFASAQWALASDIAISIAADQSTYALNGQVTLTITVDNTSMASGGPFDTGQATVQMPIPSGFTVVSAMGDGASCAVNGNAVVCTYPSVAAGAVKTITVVLTAGSSGTKEVITTISKPDFDPDTSNNTATTTFVVEEGTAVLSLSKAASKSPIRPFENFSYTITVSNTGTVDAPGVTVTDPLPDAIDYLSGSNCALSSRTVTCDFGTVAAGATVTRTFDAFANASGTVVNTAVLGPLEAQATVEVVQPSLTVTKTADKDPVSVGRPVVYTLTVTNTGTLEAPNVALSDLLPDGLTFVSSPDCTLSESTGIPRILCNAGDLAPSASKTFTFTATPNRPGQIDNTVFATGDGIIDLPRDTSTIMAARPILEVTKTADPTEARVGQTIIWTISVTNAGTVDADDVRTTDTLPEGLSLSSVSNNCVESLGLITCTTPSLAPGASVTYQIVTTATGNGTLTNTSTTTAIGMDTEVQASGSVQVEAKADLSIEKTARYRGIFQGGTNLFVLSITNNGPDAAEGVTLTENMPDDGANGLAVFTSVQAPSPCTGEQVVTCPLGTIAAGETVHVVIPVRTNPDLFGGEPLTMAQAVEYTNTAQVTSTTTDPNPSNNQDSFTGGVIQLAGTSGNTPGAESVSDPVNTFSGELHQTFDPDLHVTGPFSLSFARTYASGMGDRVGSGLGPNWSHTYAWRLFSVDQFGETRIETVTDTGRLYAFVQVDGAWVQLTGLETPMFLIPGSDGSWTLGDPRTGLARGFDSEGHLVSISDGKGNQLTLTYSGDLLAEVSDGLGRALGFSHSGGRISGATDGTRTTSYTYDADGRLATSSDALGQLTSYTYANPSGPGLLEAMVLPDGGVRFTQAFDDRGRVSTQTDALGGVTRFAYDTETRTTSVTDPAGRLTTYTYDSGGRLLETTDPTGTVTFQYDEVGRRTAITDRLGSTTWIEYDNQSGLPTRVTQTDGSVQTASYSRRDGAFPVYDVTQRTDEAGGAATYIYNALGNRISQTNPAGAVTTFTYNQKGQVLTATGPSGGVTRHTYDASGNRTSTTDPTGRVHTFGFDASSRLVSHTDPSGGTLRYGYDAADRLTEIQERDGSSRSLGFDVRGNLISITDAAGNSARLTYDGMDQVTEETDFAGNRTVYAYDPVGRLVSRTDGTGLRTTYAYDAASNLTRIDRPGGGVTRYDWDAEGILTQIQDPTGATLQLSSDPMGRTLSIHDAMGASTTVSRNGIGLPVAITGPEGESRSVSLDSFGRVTAQSDGPGSSSYVYDSAGRVTSVTTPSGGVQSFTYDAAGRITSRTDALGRSTTLMYDAGGRLQQVTRADGSTEGRSYDANGRLTAHSREDDSGSTYAYDVRGYLTGADLVSLTRDANGLIVQSNGITMERDQAGRITRIDLPGGPVTYSYDAAGRLTQVDDFNGNSTVFTRDAAGRVTRLDLPNGLASTYGYDQRGTLIAQSEISPDIPMAEFSLVRNASGFVTETAFSGYLRPEIIEGESERTFDPAYQIVGFDYDALGRRTADDRGQYTWDDASRLRSLAGDVVGTYSYDGLGNAVELGDRQLIWNYALRYPSAMVEQRAGADVYYYIYTPEGELLYRMSAGDGSLLVYHYDQAGNTRLVTNETRGIAAAYAYGPYGEPLGTWEAPEATGQPFTYQGRNGVLSLGAGYYLMRARVLDSRTASFLSPDPVVSLDPLHLNPYQYAALNPEGYIDPLGLREGKLKADDVAGTLIGGFVTGLENFTEIERLKKVNDVLGKLGGPVAGATNGAAGLNVSGLISAGFETYSSGNVARGAGVGAVDIALSANPYTAGIIIVSDLTDLGAKAVGLEAPELGNVFRNAGRAAGGLLTDIVVSPFSSDHDFGDSLAGVAEDISKQGGVPGAIFDAGDATFRFFGHTQLTRLHDANQEASALDQQVEDARRSSRINQRSTVQKYLPR